MKTAQRTIQEELLDFSAATADLATALAYALPVRSQPVRQCDRISLCLAYARGDLELAAWDRQMPYGAKNVGASAFARWIAQVEGYLAQPYDGRKPGLPLDLHERLSDETACLLRGLIALHKLLPNDVHGRRAVRGLNRAYMAVQKLRDSLRTEAERQYGIDGDLYNCKAEGTEGAILRVFQNGMEELLDRKEGAGVSNDPPGKAVKYPRKSAHIPVSVQ